MPAMIASVKIRFLIKSLSVWTQLDPDSEVVRIPRIGDG
jgi:hypothetical protein